MLSYLLIIFERVRVCALAFFSQKIVQQAVLVDLTSAIVPPAFTPSSLMRSETDRALTPPSSSGSALFSATIELNFNEPLAGVKSKGFGLFTSGADS